MATTAPNIGLYNWAGSDYFRRTEFNANFLKLDLKFDGNNGHSHDGTPGSGGELGRNAFINGAVDDYALGERTINDTIFYATDTQTITNILNTLANQM